MDPFIKKRTHYTPNPSVKGDKETPTKKILKSHNSI
jgi:hypothetical protein